MIAGDVLLPGADAYESARAPAMARFADVRPLAVVRCRYAEDVAETLAFAQASGTAVVPRGGGHCFGGRSSTHGVLVDLAPMDAVSVDGATVTADAGARLGPLYDALDACGRTVAGGCGPTVGIAGLALGGGLGILGRRHGLTCDQLRAGQVVLADGRILDCDADRHADLFWALGGAGGGRFGIVTRLVLATVPAEAATRFDLLWPVEDAAAVAGAWQTWSPDGPDELAASLLVTAPADPDRPVMVRVFGAMSASEATTRGTLEALVARAGADPVAATFAHAPYRETKRRLAADDPGAGAKPEPGHLFAKSEFFARSLPADAVAALLAHLGGERTAGTARELDFSPWAGAYGRVARDARAFPHRDARFLLKHEVVVDAAVAPAETPAARDWLARSWALAHPSGTGGAYVNFPDADLGPWDRAYHGPNLERLCAVRAAYDPAGVFA